MLHSLDFLILNPKPEIPCYNQIPARKAADLNVVYGGAEMKYLLFKVLAMWILPHTTNCVPKDSSLGGQSQKYLTVWM